ncbi:efflux RND transporter permease subunit [Elstera sp.]|jgi:hydrophobe/amphiphile efflux-1 (HAE1) family protein|uniref:efflux RND transporter permease subunit n=1 Tax=Elstera sp. TaxID=1916664 RepID=UPI0037BF716D
MAMNISGWAIRRPIPSVMLFVILMVLGAVSFVKLPITRFPNIDVPVINITVTQTGAAPAELETQITKKVEDAVAGLTGVKHITSTLTDGRSVTTIEFRLEINSDRALNDAKDAVARVRADLPRSIDEPIIERLDVVGLPIVTYAATAPSMTPEELSWFVDDVVARDLQSAKGVGQVERVGGVAREIQVTLDPNRMLALGVTAADITRALKAVNIDLAGGRSDLGAQEQSIRALGGAKTLAELAQTPLMLTGDKLLRLSDVATVTDTFAEPRTFARLDGQPVVGFSIYRSKGASDADVAKAVEARIAGLMQRHPNVSLSLIDSYVTYTVGNYHSAMDTLIEGAVLAVLVVLIFLKDLRATLITCVALPLSILPTFWVMDSLGFSLNLVSLLAITLVTGILVDDAIVEIENIVRHRHMGKSPYRAAMEAADEIGLAVVAITMTIVAVFAPVSFMGGIAGQYFKQFGITVAVAVLFSLLVARLITPMMAAYLMRGTPHLDKPEGWLMRRYTRLVDWSVRWRGVTVVVGLGIFGLSIWSSTLLPSGLMPTEDTARAVLALEFPPGTRLAETEAAADRVTQTLKELPEVRSVFVDGGRILGQGLEVRKASLIINLTPKGERNRSQSELQTIIGARMADIPDVRYWFVNEGGQRAVTLLVTGAETAVIEDLANDLAAQMRTLPLLENVMSTAALDRPEVRIVPDRERTARLGISTETLSEVVRVATIGDVSANLPKFTAGDRQIPIRVQIDRAQRGDFDLLENLTVPTAMGTPVPLGAVARLTLGQGPATINRYDRARKVSVEADLFGNTALGQATEAIRALPIVQTFPPGVELKDTGDVEIMGEVFAGFAMAMGAGVMMVYAVLVLLFGSFLQPVTILFSLPLSIGGAIFALFIAQEPISMPVVIGFLMLMGIVTKNAIMLVDFAVEEIARGVPRRDAIVDAGRKRARPIIMTTIAMAAGMIPSALAFGDGGEFRAPMAIAVIGGLIVSTVLSLVFVPAVFCLMDDVAKWLWRFFSRFIGPSEEPETETMQADHLSHTPRPQPAE